MVIEDYFHPGRPKKPATEPEKRRRRRRRRMSMASPYDRLGAAVIDLFVVLLPFLVLFVSPLRRMSMESQFLAEGSQTAFVHAGIILVAALTIMTYQTLMVWLLGASVGKMFFALRVVNIWNGKQPTFSAALLRSFGFVLDCLLLFIPHLAIFSNKKRRPPHDRIADTVVITVRGRGVRSPGLVESSFVRGVFAAVVVAILLILALNVFEFYKKTQSEGEVVSLLEQSGKLCVAVGKAQKEWTVKADTSAPTRLSVAMALFSAGLVSKSCLALEVDDSLNRQAQESSMAYLAQAFVHSDRSEISDAYLEKVCEVDSDSDSCTMSGIVDRWSKGDWEGVRSKLDELSEAAPTYIWIWGLRHMVKHGNYERVVQTIEKKISPQKPLAPFLTMQRAKAYWYLDRKSEARALASVALETFNFTDRLDLASWMCEEEVESSCSGKTSLSCDVFRHSLAETPDLLIDSQVSMTFIKERECSLGSEIDYADLMEQMRSPEARSFVEALYLHNQEEQSKARHLLEKVVYNSEGSHHFQMEARRRLITWADEPSELTELHADWSKQESNTSWLKIGRSLFESYFRMGAYGPSLDVGKRLLQFQARDEEFQKAMVISAYHLGQRETAWELLSSYLDRTSEEESGELRAPASHESFSVISRVLKKEFEEQ